MEATAWSHMASFRPMLKTYFMASYSFIVHVTTFNHTVTFNTVSHNVQMPLWSSLKTCVNYCWLDCNKIKIRLVVMRWMMKGRSIRCFPVGFANGQSSVCGGGVSLRVKARSPWLATSLVMQSCFIVRACLIFIKFSVCCINWSCMNSDLHCRTVIRESETWLCNDNNLLLLVAKSETLY